MPKNHANDRVLAGMANLPQSMPLIESEFNSLHEILGLIEIGLNAASSTDKGLFADEGVGLGASVRG